MSTPSPPDLNSNPYEPHRVGHNSRSADTSASVPRQKSIGAKAAQLSWQLPIATVLATVVMTALVRDSGLLRGYMTMAAAAVGLVAGLFAILNIPRFGVRRIVIPAVVGLILNGGIVYLFVTAILHARRAAELLRAREMMQSQ